MKDNLFRESAVDKIKSPEQLNEYMKVTGMGLWIILGGLVAVFAAFAIWGFLGSIPQTAVITGTALSPGDNPLAVYCYLPIQEAQQIAVGMPVQVSPDYAPKEQFGYIYGTVKSVGHMPVSADQLKTSLGSDFSLVTVPPGNVIQVVVALQEQNGALHWSTPKGTSVKVKVGSTCTLTVITAQRKPYQLLLK